MSIYFKGLEQNAGFGGYSLTDQILMNLQGWISQNLLTAGAYSIYRVGQDSFFSNDESNLHYVPDGRFPDRTVFEGVGRGFVWQQGSSVPADIFMVSGVYVDGNFIPVTDVSGPYRHHIDYINGRVIFDEPVSPESIVSADYCSQEVFVSSADSSEFQNLMLESVEEFLSNTVPSGTASKEHQVWLPAVFVEVQSGGGRGLQLGGGQIKERIIVLHIFADTAGDRNFLLDVLDQQNRAAFWLANINEITFPFDSYGAVVSGATNWTDFTAQYPWRKLRIQEGTCKIINSLNTKLFRGTVTYKVEIDIGSI